MKKIVLISIIIFSVVGVLGVIAYQSNSENPAPPADNTAAAPEPTVVTANPEIDATILGKWWWLSTSMSDGTTIEPAQPDVFSMTLVEDGTISITTDCNSGSGTYTITPPNQITISPLATTMRFCENSQEAEFMQSLGNVQSYFINSDRQLVMEIKFDSGSMLFTKAE